MKRGLRGLCIALGGLCLLWFLLPFLAQGILNIGNATGSAVALILLLYGLFQKWIHRQVQRLWTGIAGKILLSAAALLAAGILLLAAAATGCMIHAAGNTPPENTTVVLLGCRVYGQRPSLMLRERLEAAAAYLKENPQARCIVSGGQGDGEDISEAECMYRELQKRGIEARRIHREDRSTSTRENLLYSREILQAEGLGDTVVLVTNEFHLYRAQRIGEELGLSCYAWPGRTALWLFPTYYVRELYGIVYEWIL